MHAYRVNFGNGAVHYAGDLSKCRRFIAEWGDAWTYLERRDPDTAEWFRVR